MTTTHHNRRCAVRRRPRRNAEGQLVDRAGLALLPGIRRTTGWPHQVLQRPRAGPADVRATRAGTHAEGARVGQRIARRRCRRRRITRLPRRDLRVGEERPRLHRGSARGPTRVPRQHTVGLHQLRLRLAGGGRHARPVAQHRTRVACLAHPARRRHQFRRQDLGRVGRTGRHTVSKVSSTCWPLRCSRTPVPHGKRRDATEDDPCRRLDNRLSGSGTR